MQTSHNGTSLKESHTTSKERKTNFVLRFLTTTIKIESCRVYFSVFVVLNMISC